MRTPIEDVFRHLRETKEPDSWGLAYCVDSLFELEQSLLKREKELIMQALNDGKAMALGTIENKSVEQYYNEIFNTKEE
jgi:hypothetical protein